VNLGYIIYLHGVLYAKEYGLDRTFEGYVAAGMGEFVKSLDSEKDFIAIAENEARLSVRSSSMDSQINRTVTLVPS
jgi:peptidyl-dipeptidase Dcp